MNAPKQIIVKCSQCDRVSLHDFTGIQKLPARRDNCVWIVDGKVVYDSVELWTCRNCKSTWAREIN